jgi:MFS family permease
MIDLNFIDEGQFPVGEKQNQRPRATPASHDASNRFPSSERGNAVVAQMARVSRIRRLPWLKVAPVIVIFLSAVWLTRPSYIADTARYINEIRVHRAGLLPAGQDPFWDFGHTAWRPLINALFDRFGYLVQRARGGDEVQVLAWLMIALNVCAAFAAVLLLWAIVRRCAGAWAALIVSAALLCTNAVLDYSRSGAPYVAALACLLASLWLADLSARRRRYFLPALAGLCLGGSVVLWFPFVLAIPAAILYAAYAWKGPTGARIRALAAIAGFCGIAIIGTYSIVAQKRQIGSYAEMKSWIASSRNNWDQTDKLKRAISGVPRSFLDLGDDTLRLKRYVFHDPYAPVTLADVLFTPGTLKVLLFYLFTGAMLAALWKDARSREVLFLLFAAAVPVLLFAVTLFEPGSTERYLPAYPFFFLAAARALEAGGPGRHVRRWLGAAFLIGVLCAGNIYAKAGPRAAGNYSAFLARKEVLDNRAPRDSMAAVINFWDPLYRIPPLRLLDSRAQLRNVRVYDTIEVASTRVFRWRQEFAQNALTHWSRHGQVWLSRRLLAARPQPDWKWVEGDTGRVSWRELTRFFRSLHVESEVGGSDGFVLLTRDDYNVSCLGATARSGAAAPGACGVSRPQTAKRDQDRTTAPIPVP